MLGPLPGSTGVWTFRDCLNPGCGWVEVLARKAVADVLVEEGTFGIGVEESLKEIRGNGGVLIDGPTSEHQF
jgi:hypothetical protein